MLEKLGLIFSSFSYIFQIPFVFYLILRVKKLRIKFIEDDKDKIILVLLFISGVISSLLSSKKLEAFLVSLIPFIFVGFYILGKEGLKESNKNIIYYILLGSSILGFILFVSRIFKFSLYILEFPIVDGNAPRGLVLGVKSQGLSLLLEFGIVSGIGLLVYFERNIRDILKILLLLVFCILGFMITETRGGILGILVGLIVLISNKEFLNQLKRKWKYVLLIVFLFLLAFFIFFNQFYNRLTISLQKGRQGSIYERIYIYLGTLRMIKDNLLFGVGPGCFVYEYPKYALKNFPYVPEFILGELSHAVTTHNIYFYFLSGWGIIGSSFFFYWLFKKIYKGLKFNYSLDKHIILAILMVYFGHVLLDDLFSIHVPLLIGLLNRNKEYTLVLEK
ncbi:O-antigen ligase family protein [Dictyoglomus turgidum]|mgnify:CR=1 FL=1|uniref:O-antigen ligase family protein n=1 Tax=Dictyoglomus turgidum TaxID=513050 RepID=UPI0023539183|nr:O-antigen ligase family protein [Dictyoglomus turgidum]